jgi:hypothetical protein
MRKVIVFILAIAMIVGGLYVLASQFLWSHYILGRFVMMGAFLTTLGFALLWAAFIEPILGNKEQK